MEVRKVYLKLDFEDLDEIVRPACYACRDFSNVYADISFGNRFNQEIRKYKIFVNFFRICHKLKIFNVRAILRIIEDANVANHIIDVRETRLNQLRENFRDRQINNNDIDDILNDFTNRTPPIIKPLLINTINTTNFAKYFVTLILKNSPRTVELLNRITKYFPRVIICSGGDVFTKEQLIQVEIFLPNISEKEKDHLVSILYNLFTVNIISLKRFIRDSVYGEFSIKDFYDFEKREFFYTKDLFEQYFVYVQKIFGKELKSFKETTLKYQSIFWSRIKDFRKLIELNSNRIYDEQIDFNANDLNDLSNFHQNIMNILLNRDIFRQIRNQEFFIKYVKSIKFKPAFQRFGFGQYYLYIRPTDMNDIDLKLLFNNTFQKIRYPAQIDNVQSLFVKTIFPHRNPNKAYINWLIKAKKLISEYCIFYVKKFHILFRFDLNLDPTGWDLDANNFKIYMQRVLFDPNFNRNTPRAREYNIGDLNIINFYGPDSDFFQNLTDFYSFRSMDIKSELGTTHFSVIQKILGLLRNNLIFPYIKLKNLGFQEMIYIILPSVKKDQIETLIKVFSFFNYGFIYETEGKYFIKGDVLKFKNGLMIKLYFPLVELSDFQRVFSKLFQFLEIDKYLILNDMIDGKNLIRAVYGDFVYKLDKYNPLRNLNWNERDNKWTNHKSGDSLNN